MKINKQNYPEYVEKKTKGSPLLADCIKAFLFGGAICTLGEGIRALLLYFKVPTEDAKIWLPIIMIFLGAALTGWGIYDRLARHGGAGTAIPITGFSNSIVSSAMEFKKDESDIIGHSQKDLIDKGRVWRFSLT